MTARTPLTDTLTPVIGTKDVMVKFNICRGTAIKFMLQPELHSYYIGKKLVCEKQYFDAYLEAMNDIGGIKLSA